MHIFRHQRRPVPPPVLALLLAAFTVAGCTSTDEAATVAVPSPGAGTVLLCHHLHQKLPRRIDGLDRDDPSPRSALTAGWGDPAIILRCGVPQPAKMNDAEADGVEVNGVGWLQEQQDNGSFRFTTTLRRAYVEVTLPEQRTSEGLAPLTDFAVPVRETIPKGIAD